MKVLNTERISITDGQEIRLANAQVGQGSNIRLFVR
jgi:hypothetical protein